MRSAFFVARKRWLCCPFMGRLRPLARGEAPVPAPRAPQIHGCWPRGAWVSGQQCSPARVPVAAERVWFLPRWGTAITWAVYGLSMLAAMSGSLFSLPPEAIKATPFGAIARVPAEDFTWDARQSCCSWPHSPQGCSRCCASPSAISPFSSPRIKTAAWNARPNPGTGCHGVDKSSHDGGPRNIAAKRGSGY